MSSGDDAVMTKPGGCHLNPHGYWDGRSPAGTIGGTQRCGNGMVERSVPAVTAVECCPRDAVVMTKVSGGSGADRDALPRHSEPPFNEVWLFVRVADNTGLGA